jgi:signal transduction histidine kinase
MQEGMAEVSMTEPAAAVLQVAITIALVGLCLLLYRRYHKPYYLIWACAWFLYSLRLGAIVSFLLTGQPIWLYWHQVVTGLTALALLWAALSFSEGTRWRPWYGLLIAFPLIWSYIAIYRLDNFLLAAVPAVLFLSISTLWTGIVFLRHYRRAGSGASLFLSLALLLWAIHHLDYPFLRGRGVWNPWGYYIDIVFELAMGMGILLIVGEELQRGLHTLSALSGHLQPSHRDDLPRMLLDRAMTLPAVSGSALVLMEDGSVRVTRGAGACSGWERGPVDAYAERVLAQAVREKRPVILGGNGAATGRERGYIAALPILNREGVRGALLVVGEARDPFAALDANFLIALGRQFGAALENAELYHRLETRSAELEHMAGLMVRQHEEERRRLSRELHDETAQVFAAVNLQLGLLRESASADLVPRLDRALHLVDEGIRSIRTVTDRLRPPLLDDLGLIPALRGLIDEFVERHGIATRFEAPAAPPALSAEGELALFRALQEALSNVARHAEASHVDVRLSYDENHATLRVRDDGTGLPAEPATGRKDFAGMGLKGMRERVAMLGGQLSIRNVPGGGVELVVILPVIRQQPHE